MKYIKTAIITGSTKGIGLALSKKLLSIGYNVYMSYYNDDNRAALVRKELAQHFDTNSFIIDKVDLSDYSESIQYINKLKSEVPVVDVLILNAAATDRTSFENMKLESWERIMRVNVTIPFLFTQSLIHNIKHSMDKCIIFTGAIMGIYPHPLSIAYGVSKSAEHSLSKNLIKFLEPYGIRSNVVAPGFVETEMQKDKPVDIRESICNKLAIHRFANLDEIVDAYLFVINNKYINGSIIEIDGGYCFK
jgi:3-oxoacyl-[acyl-carrier protein] reductase